MYIAVYIFCLWGKMAKISTYIKTHTHKHTHLYTVCYNRWYGGLLRGLNAIDQPGKSIDNAYTQPQTSIWVHLTTAVTTHTHTFLIDNLCLCVRMWECLMLKLPLVHLHCELCGGQVIKLISLLWASDLLKTERMNLVLYVQYVSIPAAINLLHPVTSSIRIYIQSASQSVSLLHWAQ